MISIRRVSRFAIPAAIVLAAGCGGYFPPDINLKRRLSEGEVAGTWTMTPDALEMAKKQGYAPPPDAPHRIVFAPDGTCRFSTVLSGLEPKWFDVRGKWLLTHDRPLGGEPNGKKNQLAIEFVEPNPTGHQGASFGFTEDGGAVRMWTWWDDPDAWHLLVAYERTGGVPAEGLDCDGLSRDKCAPPCEWRRSCPMCRDLPRCRRPAVPRPESSLNMVRP